MIVVYSFPERIGCIIAILVFPVVYLAICLAQRRIISIGEVNDLITKLLCVIIDGKLQVTKRIIFSTQ